MRAIARRALKDFWIRHPDAEAPLRAWFRDVSFAKWSGPADVKRRYPSASMLGHNRVIFNIKGNTYRLVVHMRYDLNRAYVRFVGTHSDYNKIDAGTV